MSLPNIQEKENRAKIKAKHQSLQSWRPTPPSWPQRRSAETRLCEYTVREANIEQTRLSTANRLVCEQTQTGTSIELG